MIGLVLSEALLFAIAATLGCVIGWLARAQYVAITARAAEADVRALREALDEARVRRAAKP